jgi:hypothetical protein
MHCALLTVHGGTYWTEENFWGASFQDFGRVARTAAVAGDAHRVDYGPFLYTATAAFGPIGILYDVEMCDFCLYRLHWPSFDWFSIYRPTAKQARRLRTNEQAFLVARDYLKQEGKRQVSHQLDWRRVLEFIAASAMRASLKKKSED